MSKKIDLCLAVSGVVIALILGYVVAWHNIKKGERRKSSIRPASATLTGDPVLVINPGSERFHNSVSSQTDYYTGATEHRDSRVLERHKS